MARALTVCPTPGCPELTSGGRCDTCIAKAEAQRGTATDRGYGHTHRTRFRRLVLTRDPLCVCEDVAHGHGRPCLAPSAHADHHPRSRRELVQLRIDPNDPAHGRGLCGRCHSKHTAHAQPGGWHTR